MRKADNLPPYRAVVKKSGSLNFLDPSGPARPVMGELYLYLFPGQLSPKAHSLLHMSHNFISKNLNFGKLVTVTEIISLNSIKM